MFRKKKTESSNLRRRFHHFLISSRKGTVHMNRPKRKWKAPSSPLFRIGMRILSFIGIIFVLLGIFYLIFFSSFFTVTKVSIEKNGKALNLNELSPFVEKLKGKNILFANGDELAKELEETFKNEILMIKVKKSYPSQIKVTIDEYPAVLNFVVILPDKTQKFILNQIGYAVFENVENKEIPTLTLKTSQPFKPKSIIIDKDKLAKMAEAFNRFNDLFGMKVISGEWMKTERELHLLTEKNFEVWIDLTYSIEQQLSKLKRALIKLDIYRDPLEYIDLRIPGGESEKVIYKRRK